MTDKLKVKKGDKVIVITGKSKGVKGEVLKVLPKENKVVVAGANMATKRQKAGRGSLTAGVVKVESPLNVSNIQILDPKSGKPTKVGYKFLEDGRKVRFAKDSGEMLDN